MSESNGKIKLLSVIEDMNVLELIKYSLKDEDEFLLLEESRIQNGIQSQIVKSGANILLIDSDVNQAYTYNIIDNIAAQLPHVAVVVILKESEAALSEKAILSGAQAVLFFPFSKERLLSTLHRVVELTNRKFPGLASQEPKAPLPVRLNNATLMVFSPKGGTGCTTVAVNLAIAMRQLTKEPVLLVDGKPIFGNLALSLNIRTTNSISDLVSHAGLLDAPLIDRVVVEHASGIKVLASPTGATEAQGIHAEDLYKVLVKLQSLYPVIIIDGGNYLHENTVTLMDASNKIIVVMNPNLASMMNVRQFIDIGQMLSYPPEKIMLVMNNCGNKTDVRQDEVENLLKKKIACRIPGDTNSFVSSLNEGIPLMLKKVRHPANKAIQKLATEITSELAGKNGNK